MESSAWIAVVAIIVSVVSLITTTVMWFKSHAFQTRTQQRQYEWQRAQEARRQHERIEDIARAEAVATPQIEVEIIPDDKIHWILDASKGMDELGEYSETEALLVVRAKNTGLVRVQMGAPYLLIDRTTKLEFNPYSFVRPDSVKLFPTSVEPGASIDVRLSAEELVDEVQEHGHTDTVEIVAIYRDQIDNEYTSQPLTLNIDRFV